MKLAGNFCSLIETGSKLVIWGAFTTLFVTAHLATAALWLAFWAITGDRREANN